MTFVPIPHVVDGALIETLWGNNVADDLAYLKTQADNAARVRGHRAVRAANAVAPASQTTVVVTLTTPVIPAGAIAVVLMSVIHAQASGSGAAYDISYAVPTALIPTGSVVDQVPSGIASNRISNYTGSIVGTGAALTLTASINTWGGQAVNMNAGCSISVIVVGP